jgi:hypothetical protein
VKRPGIPAAWFAAQSFTSADRDRPAYVAPPRVCACGGSGGTADRWDGKRFRSYTVCCSAECDALGIRLDGAA